MTKSITIAIEAVDADQASAELSAIDGVVAEDQTPTATGNARDAGATLVAIVAIVTITRGVVEIADKIINWRDKWKQANAGKPLGGVVQDTRGNRIRLDDATKEQIAAALRSMQS